MKTKILTLSLLVFVLNPATAISEVEHPSFKPLELKSSTLTTVGSDAMASLMQNWIEAYKKYQTNVDVRVSSNGSATAPVALIDGSADIGHMARPMKRVEVRDFKVRYGFEPTAIKTALSSVAVYVSDENPLNKISIQELDAIFSKSSKRGLNNVSTWKEVGVHGSLSKQDIVAFRRSENSFANFSFKQRALLQADFSDDIAEIASIDSLFDAVRANKNSIAFGEVVFPTPKGVKVLAVSSGQVTEAIRPTTKTISKGAYPLSRPLNFYFVKEPSKGLDKPTEDFLNFVLSQQGQEIVSELGLIKLSESQLAAERAKY